LLDVVLRRNFAGRPWDLKSSGELLTDFRDTDHVRVDDGVQEGVVEEGNPVQRDVPEESASCQFVP